VEDINAHIQISCARNIRWLIGRVTVEAGALAIDGWALPFGIPADRYCFFLNGAPFRQVHWPLPSPDLADVFSLLRSAERARFECTQPFDNLDQIFKDGFARLDWCAGEPNQRSYRHAWYFPDPRRLAPLPEAHRIMRVIGAADMDSYLYGGASLRKRFEEYLLERFDKPLSTFSNILDWGCGSGRLTRHLTGLGNTQVTGCDIDADNIEWCRGNLKGSRFVVVPLLPPTAFEDAQFDLVIGCSVFTHLEESVQFAWLKELQRITAPGGLVLVSITGLSQMALYRAGPEYFAKIETEGFVNFAPNAQLDGVVQGGYYRDVVQSRDYVFLQWGKYFEIVDIVDALAANQDLVVMRRR
jgi:SAM-dependent methyltransferase